MELRADGQADVYNHGHLVFTAGVLDMNLLKVGHAVLSSLCCSSASGMRYGSARAACPNGIVCLHFQEMGEIAPLGGSISSSNLSSSSGQDGTEMRAGAEEEGPIIAPAKVAGH